MNGYLLDTHIVLWWVDNPQLLSSEAQQIITNGRNRILVSVASAWEVAIKQNLGKLHAPLSVEEMIEKARFVSLPIQFTHIAQLAKLPPIHSDPFDRLLIAQAQIENLTLITRDEALFGYGVPTIRG